MRRAPFWSGAVVLLLLALAGCDGDVKRGDRPPGDPPPPIPSTIERGIHGRYDLVGDAWYLDAEAYSHRFHTATHRLSVYSLDEVAGATAVRISQPAGQGPPFEGLDRRLSIVEVELYDRPDSARSRYEHDPAQNLMSTTRPMVAASSTGGRIMPDVTIDGFVAGRHGHGAWESTSEDATHSITFTFETPVTFDQLVVYWPVVDATGPWPRDRSVLQGLRPQHIELWIDAGQGWKRVDILEHLPGSRHDGHFITELLGLEREATSRLAHLDALAEGKPWFPRDPDAVAGPNETVVNDHWSILWTRGAFESARPARGDPDTLSRRAALELATMLRRDHGLHLGVDARAPAAEVPANTIVIGSLSEAPQERNDAHAACDRAGAFVIEVDADRIHIRGFDVSGARHGAARLGAIFDGRGAPFAVRGVSWRRPAFAPRIASGVSFGEGGPDGLGFPDGYLAAMARYGLDGIYLFQAGGFTDATSIVGSTLDPVLRGDAGKRDALRGLVRRAADQGLGVYWMISVPGVLPPEVYDRHREITDGYRPYTICLSRAEGRAFVTDLITRIVTDIPGLAGLLVVRSEFSHGCGGRGRCERCRLETTPDLDPIHDVFDWVADAAHSVDPEVAVMAMDWRAGDIPPPDVERLPPGVDLWLRADRMANGSPENDIRDVVPSAEARDLMRRSPRGQRAWIEIQPSHPFPFHAQPEVAAADLYWRKLTGLRELSSGPLAICGGNGSGFAPTPMQDLVYRTLLWDPLPSKQDAFLEVATRWFGPEAAGTVVDGWMQLSHALRAHTSIRKYVSRMVIVQPPGSDPELVGAAAGQEAKILLSSWRDGVATLASAAPHVSAHRQQHFDDALVWARAVEENLLLIVCAAEWADRFGDLDLASTPTLPADQRAYARDILARDLAATRTLMEIAIDHSWLRAHGYYRSWFSLPVLRDREKAVVTAWLATSR